MKMIRKLFQKKKLDGVMDSMANQIVKDLTEHEGKENLLNFLEGVQEGYVKFRDLMEKHGGFRKSPQEIQLAFFQILSKMVTLPYFIKFKYGIPLPLWDFHLPEYEDL